MPTRYPPNPYRVTLDLDPVTSDALTQAAKATGSTRHRLAYEFVQRGLASASTAPAADPGVDPALDPVASAIRRTLDDLASRASR